VEDVGVNPDFWRQRKVLVTGDTGFKGSWLSLWLAEMGADVTGYSAPPPTDPSLFELARVGDVIRHVEGDVRDRASFADTVAEQRPEVVIHMAAQSLVRRSYRDPVETYETNVVGTVNLLEAARRVDDVRVVVNVTTDKVYENPERGEAFTEDEPKGGHDPYSNSKACSELVTAAYRDSFFHESGAAVATARAGNVIGGGDWGEDRLVPDLMRAAAEGAAVPIRNPGSVRPWQHVLNPLSGYLLLAESLWESNAHADAWNFGPGEEDSLAVRQVVERLAELWPGGIEWRDDSGDHPHEARYLRLDSTKARTQLGWSPLWGLDRGLESIVQWHRGLQAGEDARELTVRQIHEYQSDARAAAPARAG
jgi:CDP-glucose 4,6-dehydratase